MNTDLHLSLVIPCYNEERNVPTLLARRGVARHARQAVRGDLIDDGSTDATPRLLAEAQAVCRGCGS
jgi:hypothetical protein